MEAAIASGSAFAAGCEHPAALGCEQVQALADQAESGSPLLIDVRAPHHFRRGHIAGSHSIPSGLLLSGEPPQGELILISEVPQQALALIDALHEAGYCQRLRYLAGGLAAWRSRGLPLQVDASPRPGGLVDVLLPGLAGTGLLFAAAMLSSLPLLGLGVLLLWGAWIEPALSGQPRRQRLI